MYRAIASIVVLLCVGGAWFLFGDTKKSEQSASPQQEQVQQGKGSEAGNPPPPPAPQPEQPGNKQMNF